MNKFSDYLAGDSLRWQRWIPFLVAAVFFMENLDATVITTVLPAMAASFKVRPEQLSVGVSAYMLALAICIPMSGWLAERFGARRIFSLAVIIFTMASVLCALAGGLTAFVVARVLQGVGGAMMVPVGRLVVLKNTPKKDLVRAIATITWPGLAAPVLGATVGALVASRWGWPWIFLLNLPLGMLALLAARIMLSPIAGQRRQFDLTGFVLLGIGCGALMIGMELASERPTATIIIVALLAIALTAFLSAFRTMRNIAHPMIDPRVLAVRSFTVTICGGSLFRTAVGSAPFLLPLMLQLAFGWDALQAGFLLMALFAGNLAMKPATSWILRRFGFRRILIWNGLLTAAGFALCALFSATTPVSVMAVIFFACGLSRSMQYTAMNTLGFADVPSSQMNGATTLFSMAQQMNIGMGVAYGALGLSVATVLQSTFTWVPQGAAWQFHLALWMVAILALCAVIDSFGLPHDAGDAVSGYRPRFSKSSV